MSQVGLCRQGEWMRLPMTNSRTEPAAAALPAALKQLASVTSAAERTLLAPGARTSWKAAEHSGLSARTYVALNIKATRLATAIRLLAEARSLEATGVLLRTLFELGLLLSKDDRHVRALMFHTYSAYQWVKMQRKTQGDPLLATPEGAKDLEELQAIYRRYAAKLPPDVDVRGHWSGGTTETAAEALDQGALYQTLFRLTSRHVHHTDLDDMVQFTDEGIVEKAVPAERRDEDLCRMVRTTTLIVGEMAILTAVEGGVDHRELLELLS